MTPSAAPSQTCKKVDAIVRGHQRDLDEIDNKLVKNARNGKLESHHADTLSAIAKPLSARRNSNRKWRARISRRPAIDFPDPVPCGAALSFPLGI